MQDDHQKDLKDINTKHLAEVENKKQEIAALDENYEDITNWLLIEADKEFERQTLQNTFNGIIHKHQQEMDNIKRERGIAIDKLRKEMLQNIRNVKTQMLTMNEEQLQGTTKMTVKQNVQLTSELEYQSKNTEELSFENEKMKD